MDTITLEETETLAMLYRHRREFAVGHGVSVHATAHKSAAQIPHERAVQVKTVWIHCHEVSQQTARDVVDDENLAGHERAAQAAIARCVTYCGDELGQFEFSEKQAPKEGLPLWWWMKKSTAAHRPC